MRSLRLASCTLFAIALTGILSVDIMAQPTKKPIKKPVVKSAPAKPVAPKKIPGTRVLVMTDSGNMVIRLYDSTPLHRDNFIAKVNEGFYDSLMFHRVIRGFMIQGGDPNSKNAKPGEMLGMGSAPGDRIPAEFRPYLFHKKGVLAAARDGNPEKASSNCQFYIVQGKKYTDPELGMYGMPADQKLVYKTLGGTPMLDQGYTVYGEVEIGLNVIDKIAGVPTSGPPTDRPNNDVRMKMKVLSDEEFNVLWKKELNNIKKPVVKKMPPKVLKKKTS
ncbi:MAG: peptidylprolyl isomerase [Bacteroidota bacterium]